MCLEKVSAWDVIQRFPKVATEEFMATLYTIDDIMNNTQERLMQLQDRGNESVGMRRPV